MPQADREVPATHAYRDVGGRATQDAKAEAYREVGGRATQDAKADAYRDVGGRAPQDAKADAYRAVGGSATQDVKAKAEGPVAKQASEALILPEKQQSRFSFRAGLCYSKQVQRRPNLKNRVGRSLLFSRPQTRPNRHALKQFSNERAGSVSWRAGV